MRRIILFSVLAFTVASLLFACSGSSQDSQNEDEQKQRVVVTNFSGGKAPAGTSSVIKTNGGQSTDHNDGSNTAENDGASEPNYESGTNNAQPDDSSDETNGSSGEEANENDSHDDGENNQSDENGEGEGEETEEDDGPLAGDFFPPCRFSGTVTLGGDFVDDDTIVTAVIEAETVASTTTMNSWYRIEIPGDYQGKKVLLYTVGTKAAIRDWEQGGNITLNLEVP